MNEKASLGEWQKNRRSTEWHKIVMLCNLSTTAFVLRTGKDLLRPISTNIRISHFACELIVPSQDPKKYSHIAKRSDVDWRQ